MCPPDYHQNGFVLTHALGHIMSLHIAGTNEPECSTYQARNIILVVISDP